MFCISETVSGLDSVPTRVIVYTPSLTDEVNFVNFVQVFPSVELMTSTVLTLIPATAPGVTVIVEPT